MTQKDPSVSLHEDDPEAMSYICMALHHRQDFSEVISLELLEKVAVLCDKYDLTAALQASSELALQTWTVQCQGTKDCIKMLKLAYALNGHQAFWTSSCKLLFRCEGIEGKVTDRDGAFLVYALIGGHSFGIYPPLNAFLFLILIFSARFHQTPAGEYPDVPPEDRRG